MAFTKAKSQVTIRDRLSQWDSRLAPLSDHQKDSFMQLSSAASFRPTPSHVSKYSHPGTPLHLLCVKISIEISFQ